VAAPVDAFRCRWSWQRCFDEHLAVKKAARTIYVGHRFVESFFIMVLAMRSNRSRTSDVNRFDSEIFSRAMNFLSR